MRRGFKADAERQSEALRKMLGINYNEPLDCFMLLESNHIPTYTVEKMAELGLSTEDIYTICYGEGKQQFSAITISDSLGHIIFYNQSHSFARTNSSLAHELSHILLMHEFSSINKLKMLSREFDKDKEDEADWLAGCLLLPEKGLIWAIKKGMSIQEIATHFHISFHMAKWRYNSTGMQKRIRFII